MPERSTESPFAAVPMTLTYTRVAQSSWEPLAGSELEFRDLGLGRATSGAMSAGYIRAPEGSATVRWHDPTKGPQMLLIRAGTLDVESGGEVTTLKEGDIVAKRSGVPGGALVASSEFEAIYVAASEQYAIGQDSAEPAATAVADPYIVQPLTDDAFIVGDGPRSFSAYRTTGLGEATGGWLDVNLNTYLAAPDGGTGWHTHSMSQMFTPLAIGCEIEIEGHPLAFVEPGGAVCIPARTPHNVPSVNVGAMFMEICSPQYYDTISCPAPAATVGEAR
jgi:quercetin dioxygenase-like cupin family protein